MDALTRLSATELDRQRKVSDIADWYRGEPALAELERVGRHVLVSVDHVHRIIRVECNERLGTLRTPIEERMEFDKDVLSMVKHDIEDDNHVVILDTSDIPGRIGHGQSMTRGFSAKISVLEIDSSEPVEERVIIKASPEFPEQLIKDLAAVPKGPGESYIALRTFVAERFVSEYLSACLTGPKHQAA